MERKAKLRRLDAMRRRLPHVTASALSAVLRHVSEHGMPDLTDRKSMREARNLQNGADTQYGPILQSMDVVATNGATYTVPVAHPLAMLFTAVSSCAAFANFFHAKLREQPPSPESPWSLILYSDEVTPGNPLSNANKRRFHAIYWSFAEFGPNAVSREESWFCLMTQFSVDVNKLHAELSQIMGQLLKPFFQRGGYD